MYMTQNRMLGPYAPAYWALILCNVIVPQALWSVRVRANPILLFVIAIIVNIGMWLERFVIVITSLHRDFLPSSWGNYLPTVWDVGDFRRHHRIVPDPGISVHPFPADDFDIRNAHAVAAGGN